MPARIQLLLLLVFVTAIRLPFVHQAFQLDDPYYLEGARYVQHDPLHPSHTRLVFQGQEVDLRGHPHPPLDIWFLGLVLRVRGHIGETSFHLAYLSFSLLATAAMFILAWRFTRHAALATLVFIAVPAFIVHGNGVESDLPLLALSLAGAAAFIRAVDMVNGRWLAGAAVFLGLASLAAYQAVLFFPILGIYAWQRKRAWWPALAVSATPIAVISLYQAFEWLTSGSLPASVVVSHFQTYHVQSMHNKLRSAAALTAHLGWMLFPPTAMAAFGRLSRRLWIVAGLVTLAGVAIDRSPLFWVAFGVGTIVFLYCLRRLRDADVDTAFLTAWVAIFFAGALVIFFAGAARYLLPLAAPLAILAARALERRPKWLVAAFEAQIIFALVLAYVHYQQSGAYRDFVRAAQPQFAGHRVFLNGEWGLQYYGQQAGARPLLRDEQVQPGDILLTSRLGFPIPVNAPGCEFKPLSTWRVTPSYALRLIALGTRSAFSTIAFGVRPFDISTAPADILTAELVMPKLPKLAFLPMYALLFAPDAADQFVSGFYELEAKRWRWIGKEAVALLRPAEKPARLIVDFVIPAAAPARHISLSLNGVVVAGQTYPAPGHYTLSSADLPPGKAAATVKITVDKTFTPPGDARVLGVIVNDVGFQ